VQATNLLERSGAADMKLRTLRIKGFQSFGEIPTVIDLEPMTFLLGPNGAGKTAVLQALARLFAFDPSLRRVRRSDFHVQHGAAVKEAEPQPTLWIEAQFEFPEAKKGTANHPTIPSHFAHMRLESPDGVPRVRFRLTATLDDDGDVDERFEYMLEVDKAGDPTKTSAVPKHDRNAIHVHYLPARRDPTDHITFAAGSMLGRALRAADWKAERDTIAQLTREITGALSENSAVAGIGKELAESWKAVHRGDYYTDPTLAFERSEVESLLRHMTVGFAKGPSEATVEFTRLSDGQKSLLYLSLVLSLQAIGRKVLSKELDSFDIDKLRPALFTLVAMEEPENSLSPHYLGRVIRALTEFSGHFDAQAMVATHAPSLLRRVPPERVRYLRLDGKRETIVSGVQMPETSDEAHKFVREAVQAFPELYFSRLVVLGEGDSEEVVLPRVMSALGLASDDSAISVVPLGGRHVNHFWRLLNGLGIPYVTLLDLDLARYQGGWGRLRYAVKQLKLLAPDDAGLAKVEPDGLPKWNGDDNVTTSKLGTEWLKYLENRGVFYSAPLDLDFAMLRAFPGTYGLKKSDVKEPDQATLAAVLGKKPGTLAHYQSADQQHFDAYHERFKLGSKPAAHLGAMADMEDAQLVTRTPGSILRMLEVVKRKLAEIPE